jgi:hypothetical protein
MTKTPSCEEGLAAASAFDEEVRFLLSVPRSVILQREEEYKKQVSANPNRRGPKRKLAKPSVSPDPAV